MVSLLVGGSETFGALLGLYPGLLLTGVRRRQVRRRDLPEVVDSFLVGCRWVLVLHSLSRGRSGSVLSPRSGLSVPGRCARSCRRGCFVNGDFRSVSGRHLCQTPQSRCLVCPDLLILLGRFVGGPLLWVAFRHLSRNWELAGIRILFEDWLGIGVPIGDSNWLLFLELGEGVSSLGVWCAAFSGVVVLLLLGVWILTGSCLLLGLFGWMAGSFLCCL